MSREWISNADPRWRMHCDNPACDTVSEAFPTQPPLELFRDRGWFIAKCHGDRCPSCIANGNGPHAKPYTSFIDTEKES